MVKQSLCDATPHDAAEAAETVLARADLLAQCTDQDDGITRLFCSPAMAAAHELVRTWMEEAGMSTRLDAAGNLTGRYGPAEGKTLLIGSHLDTVVDAGRYDGVLGVLMGLATVEAVARRGESLPWAIEVIGFSDEEGVRYGTPFLGSRALAGAFPDSLLELTDCDGIRVDEALRQFGVEPAAIPALAVDPQQIVGYLEPHLEQTRWLEQADAPLAVVTAIAGQSRYVLDWRGPGGHAGGVPMHERADPLVAAARWIAEADEIGRAIPGLMATFGRVDVEPCVSNCIPRRAVVSLDLRHPENSVRREVAGRVLELAESIRDDCGVRLESTEQLNQTAVTLDAALNDRLVAAADNAGHRIERVVCGAGHDAAVMASCVPSTMLLVRSPGGISHAPEETVVSADVAAGLQTIDLFIRQLGESHVR